MFLRFFLQNRWESPNDSNDSILWMSWETGPDVNKIEASQHVRTVRASKPRQASIFLSPEPPKIAACQHCWTVGIPKPRRLLAFWDSGSPKTSRGPNWFAALRLEAPNDSNESILQRSWKNGPKIKITLRPLKFWDGGRV